MFIQIYAEWTYFRSVESFVFSFTCLFFVTDIFFHETNGSILLFANSDNASLNSVVHLSPKSPAYDLLSKMLE